MAVASVGVGLLVRRPKQVRCHLGIFHRKHGRVNATACKTGRPCTALAWTASAPHNQLPVCWHQEWGWQSWRQGRHCHTHLWPAACIGELKVSLHAVGT
jgi:hypothetical protein